MKPYDKLVGIHSAAEVAYAAWETEMVKFSQAFLTTLRNELGWPEVAFTRLDQGEVPIGGRRAPGGYADPTGYHFAVRIGLNQSWLQVVFAASRGEEEGDHVVKIGTDTFPVELDDAKTFEPIVQGIVDEMTKIVLQREVAPQTGYEL
jgi:hypothetical protein